MRRATIGRIGTVAAVVVASVAWSTQAVAQAFPARPITVVVPFPPGGVTDPVARVVGAKVSESVGQQVLIDNKPGAGGILAAETVKRAAADGYTLLMGHAATHAVNLALYSKLPYDPVKDFAPITLMISTSHVLVVHPDSPARSVADLVAMSRTKPLTFASQGVGAGGHLLGEMFKSVTGGQFAHVPYKGSAPALQDLLSNRVDLFFDAVITAAPHVRDNKLRAIGMPSKNRHRFFPNTPTMAEAGYPSVDLDFWFALYAPAGTPQPVVRRLNDEFVRALRNPEIAKRFTDQGLDVVTSTPEELAALGAADTGRLGKVVRDSGAKAD
jgi:tripartite-type tricarboxylate transporter receptor subunit TctC